MNSVIRAYSGTGAKELFDIFEENRPEVERILRSIKGVVRYALARSGEAGFTVMICQDQADFDESVQKARDWVTKNASHTAITVGDVILSLK